MILLEFSMFPVGKGESLSRYVARSLDIIDRSGLDYRLGPMGTVLEGDWDECMAVVRQCYEAMRKDCPRVYCAIKIDHRRGRRGRLRSKTASVESKLGRKLKTT
ncbi:MAG: MTH1187 family thiamine-binding protein [Verrucomicrobiae bacterium]|nr:MTH1187 family thiamine-binding protein [Verrucomicrobiae bacterium]